MKPTLKNGNDKRMKPKMTKQRSIQFNQNKKPLANSLHACQIFSQNQVIGRPTFHVSPSNFLQALTLYSCMQSLSNLSRLEKIFLECNCRALVRRVVQQIIHSLVFCTRRHCSFVEQSTDFAFCRKKNSLETLTFINFTQYRNNTLRPFEF